MATTEMKMTLVKNSTSSFGASQSLSFGADVSPPPASPAKKRRTVFQELSYMRGYELSVAEGRAEAYEGSVSTILSSTQALVNILIGPGVAFQVLLVLACLLDSFVYVSLASTGSALILSTISPDTGSRSIEEMTGSLFVFALAVATVNISKHFLTHHVSNWLTNRAKFAISRSSVQLTEKEESDVMAHLNTVRHMFVNERYGLFTSYLTELFAIIGIGIIDLNLMGFAVVLSFISHLLSSLDDFFIIQEQHHLNDIVVASDDEKPRRGTEVSENNRFFHNATSSRHVAVKMCHTAWAYISPVVFFYIAVTMAAWTSDVKGSVDTKQVLEACVFFFLVTSCQIAHHGRMVALLRNVHHCDKVLQFERAHGNMFAAVKGVGETVPYSKTKSVGRFTLTAAEKVGLVIVSGFLVVMVIVSAVFFSEVDLGCKAVEIMCTYEPDTGVHSTFKTPQVFNALLGCELSLSSEEIVDFCQESLSASDTDAEVVDFHLMSASYSGDSEDSPFLAPDVLAANDAIATLQREARAVPAMQNTEGSKVIVSASYGTWRTGAVHKFDKTYFATAAVEVDEEGNRRKLAGTTLTSTAPVFSSSPTLTSSNPFVYYIEVVVGSLIYDDSPNEVTIQIVGTDGAVTGIKSLGSNFKLGQSRVFQVSDSVEIKNVAKYILTTNGSNGVRFDSIEVNRFAGTNTAGWCDIIMNDLLACRGTKSLGTYTCSMDVPVVYANTNMEDTTTVATTCLSETCAYSPTTNPPLSFSSLSNYPSTLSASAAAGTDMLTYPFGTTWNQCTTINGPSRFAHTAVCDGGCAERAGTFRLSPVGYFAIAANGNPAGPNNNAGCQQKGGDAYPNYCMLPLKNGAPWSLAGLSGSEISAQCTKVLGHDRGHQIPANNWDSDLAVCAMTNYMSNILPQADMMNRGAWLRVEMMVECARQLQPITILGGSVFVNPATVATTTPLPTEWAGFDRTDWFMPSHYVRTPAYQWKVIVAKATATLPQKTLAIWMVNSEQAVANKVNEYIVSIADLEVLLARWGTPEVFNIADKNTKPAAIWEDQAGCSRM